MNLRADDRAFRRIRCLSAGAGSLLAIGGVCAWAMVTQQLRHEKITVPEHADLLPGRRVQGPVTAFAQSLAIQRNAEHIAGGRTFADISDALHGVDPQSDEAKKLHSQSTTLATAASLRTSLMTSVLAYGVSGLATGLGVLILAVGSQIGKALRH